MTNKQTSLGGRKGLFLQHFAPSDSQFRLSSFPLSVGAGQ